MNKVYVQEMTKEMRKREEARLERQYDRKRFWEQAFELYFYSGVPAEVSAKHADEALAEYDKRFTAIAERDPIDQETRDG